MKIVYVAAAIPIVALCCLALFAGLALGDVQRIPMQWGPSGEPNWYAPKWIGLTLIPVFGVFGIVNLMIVRRGEPENVIVRDVAICGTIVVAGDLLHLYLVGIFS